MYITQCTVLIVHASFINTAIHLELKCYGSPTVSAWVSIRYRKHIFDILKAKRATLSDANFEKLMFMKEQNDHHVETMEQEKQNNKP